MVTLQELNTVLNVFAVIGIAAGSVVYSRSRISSETIKMYKENQEAQDSRITVLEGQRSDDKTEIISLREELKVIKTLPLSDIAETLSKMMEAQNSILATQNTILQHLQMLPPPSPVTINTPAVVEKRS